MSMVKEFDEFALKGNVMDLAVGVIIGGAFSTIVNSVVKDLIMPVVGVATGGLDFSNKFIRLGDIPAELQSAVRNRVKTCKQRALPCSVMARSLRCSSTSSSSRLSFS